MIKNQDKEEEEDDDEDEDEDEEWVTSGANQPCRI